MIEPAKQTCGSCLWQRKLVCKNPKSVRVDNPITRGTPACDYIMTAMVGGAAK